MTQPSTERALNIRERDKALADAVHRKDRKATAEFVQQYADGIYAYVRGRIRPNAVDAEDLTQEVFLAAQRSIGAYRAQSSLKTWLLGIARHKVDDYYRARMHEADWEEADADMADVVELDSALEQQQVQERVVTIMDHLPEQYRLLLRWRYWDQRKTEEIAESLGRSSKAVERMLARAREHFRSAWETAQ